MGCIAKRYRKLRFENLEDRQLLTTYPDGFEESIVGTGLTAPTSMTFTPDGRILVAEKAGDIRVIQNGVLLPTPMLSISVMSLDEMGVESIEVDPQFSQNGFVYIYYTRNTLPNPLNRLSRFQISSFDANLINPGSETVLIDGIVAGSPGFHNGGMLHFAPDGMLYLGVGDTVKTNLVQDLSTYQGKILRIRPSTYPNIVPADNPYVSTIGAKPEIWARGFRNPFTGAVHPTTGALYVNDVGLVTWEEINEIQRGGNYGWPLKEGPANDAAYIDGIYSYLHDPVIGGSITGGVFYTGTTYPVDYRDDYFFSDYALGFIRRMDTATQQVVDFTIDPVTPIDLDVGPDGNLYWMSITDGSVRRVSYTTGNRAPEANAAADLTSGYFPLTVNFSSAGSEDPDGDLLTYSWNFGDGTTSTAENPTHIYTADGTYDVVLTVSDGDRTGSSLPIRIILGGTAPNVNITSPTVGSRYRAGDTISFSGTAVDHNLVPLPVSAYEWTVTFHHRTHFHPFISSLPGVSSGSFTIPATGEADPVQFYRLTLKVTNSTGITSTRTVDVQPHTSPVTLTANVPGLTLLLDNRPIESPYSFTGVENFAFQLEAPDRQIFNGLEHVFQTWSNGLPQTHTFQVPTQDNLTYTANYLTLPNEVALVATPRLDWYVNELRTYNVSVTNLTSSTWLNSGVSAVTVEIKFGNNSPVLFNLPSSVAPNATVLVPVSVLAPNLPGSYQIEHRVKQSGVYLRGFDIDSASVSGLAASISVAPPTSWNREDVQSYAVSITNTGTETWSNIGSTPVNLGVYFSGASDEIDTWPTEPSRYPLPQSVAPGQTVTFNISVQSPATPGSYILRHRMVKEQVSWFQSLHKTSVTVSNFYTYAATYNLASPTEWTINELKTYNISITNTGTATWNNTAPNDVKLGVYFAGASDVPGDWPTEPTRFQLPNNVAPGQTVTLAISMQAPLAAGTFTLRHRMVKENVAWFSSMSKVSANIVFVPALVASYTVTPPTSWNREDVKTYSITIKNTGSQAWLPTGTTKVQLGVYFGGSSDAAGAWSAEPKRFAIPRTIQPGESFTLPLSVKAPATGGSYTLRHRMVQETVSWFTSMSKSAVTVSNLYSLAANYSVTPATTWTINQVRTYSITITNTGAETWAPTGTNKVQLGIYFGGTSDAAGAWTTQPTRFALTRSVATGQSITLTITLRAPSTAGNYILRHRMVKENVAWFDTISKTNVSVGL